MTPDFRMSGSMIRHPLKKGRGKASSGKRGLFLRFGDFDPKTQSRVFLDPEYLKERGGKVFERGLSVLGVSTLRIQGDTYYVPHGVDASRASYDVGSDYLFTLYHRYKGAPIYLVRGDQIPLQRSGLRAKAPDWLKEVLGNALSELDFARAEQKKAQGWSEQQAQAEGWGSKREALREMALSIKSLGKVVEQHKQNLLWTVEMGSDGEPLIINAKKVRRVSPEQILIHNRTLEPSLEGHLGWTLADYWKGQTSPPRGKDSWSLTAMIRHPERSLTGGALTEFENTSLNGALNNLAVGMTLLVAQRLISASPAFTVIEVEKYLHARRNFHPQFTQAAGLVAQALDDGDSGIAAPHTVSQALWRLSEATPQQFTLLGVTAGRALHGLGRGVFQDASVAWRRFFGILRDSFDLKARDYFQINDTFKWAILHLDMPPFVKTLLRRLMKASHSNSHLYEELSDPGAWFAMTPGQKADIKARLEEAKDQIKDIWTTIEDPDERSKVYKHWGGIEAAAIAEAGVNANIILRGHEIPLTKVLAKEKNIQPDGVTDYVLNKIIGYILDEKERNKDYAFGNKNQQAMRKAVTLLKKARTYDTMARILTSLIDAKILFPDVMKTFVALKDQTRLNKVVQSGRTPQALNYTPMNADEFKDKFGADMVRFIGDWSEDQKRDTLGRAARAVSDLQMIFGKDFCKGGPRPLNFRFEAGEGISTGAMASYFAWGTEDEWGRKINDWAPQVKFGQNFDGLMAHELSHYIDEIIQYKTRKLTQTEEPKPNDYKPLPNTLFINTGVSLDYVLETAEKRADQDPVQQAFPEIMDAMRAIHATPDYQRWKDMIGGALGEWMSTAIRNVTGMDTYDHPEYKNWEDTHRFKSDFPPEIIAEAERLYVWASEGDRRRLTYFDSGVEIWARTIEQYVYTRLADRGITNPWLTRMTYDPSVTTQFMDQERFESEIAPILDRLFDKLKSRKVLSTRQRKAQALARMHLNQMRHAFSLQGARMVKARTLYHGTTIDARQSVRDIGLVPSIGAFVEEMYGGTEDLSEMVFLGDKKGLSSVLTAMTAQIGHKLGKGMHDVTDEEILRHGMVLKLIDGDEFMEHHDGSDDHEAPAEPGDYYSYNAVQVDEYLTGKPMLRLFKRYGLWPRDWNFSPRKNLEEHLIYLAIKRHGRGMRREILDKIRSLSVKELQDMLRTYRGYK